jgi:RHS repeat-associated protein
LTKSLLTSHNIVFTTCLRKAGFEYAPRGTDGSGFERKFVGNSLDSESGFYNMGARPYHAGLARFVTPEPQYHGLAGISPYSYSFNNPLKFKDNDGRNPIVVWGISSKG